MISEDEPLTVNWGNTQPEARRDSATFEVSHPESLRALEDALGDGTKILAYARIRVTEPRYETAEAADVEVLPSTVPGAPIVAIGCGRDHFVHVYVGVEDEATMMSVLTHDIQILAAPC
jgi:hypothetical protein